MDMAIVEVIAGSIVGVIIGIALNQWIKKREKDEEYNRLYIKFAHKNVECEQLRSKNSMFVELLTDSVRDRSNISAPEDEVVLELCERWGYGAISDSAVRLYHKKHGGTAFTLGHTRAVVENALGLPVEDLKLKQNALEAQSEQNRA